MCNFQQIDPFSSGQKTGFLRFSRYPEIQFEQTFFCFVGLNELYKIKKVCSNWITSCWDNRKKEFQQIVSILAKSGIWKMWPILEISGVLSIYANINFVLEWHSGLDRNLAILVLSLQEIWFFFNLVLERDSGLGY